jgi:fibronectin type 3 domain-containing protein
MKTTIKTHVPQAAVRRVPLFLAAILALAALSCAPEVQLSSRDWAEATADKNAALESIGNDDLMKPVFNFRYSSTSISQEVSITFPNQADVLRENNANIGNKMKEFIKFYSYTKGGAANTADSLGREYDYSFVSRIPGGKDTTIIKVNIGSLSYSDSVVAKVFASTYTFAKGKKLGSDGDTQTGTEYHDVYQTLQSGTQTGVFSSPYKRWSIDIHFNPHFSSGANSAFDYASVVTVNGIYDDGIRNTVLADLAASGKFKLKQFNGSAWQDVGTPPPSYDRTTGEIQLYFVPEDLKTYRVEVSGLENLTVGSYYGVTQRMRVSVNNDTPVFHRKTVATNTYTYKANIGSRRLLEGQDLINGSVLKTVDTGNKDVIVQVDFKYITISGSGGYYPGRMDLAEFKKNVKIFTVLGGSFPANMNGVVNAKNLYFLDIKNVDYTGYYITIELDSEYEFSALGELGFLIAPGFNYGTPAIIPGNYSNWQYEIDGVRYFDYYGSIHLGGSGFAPGGGHGSNLPAPTGLSVTGTTSNSVSLSWNSVRGASCYGVYRRSSGDYDFVDLVYSTSYTDTGLSASTTYYYIVYAADSNDEFGYPSSVSATTRSSGSLPDVPTGLTASATSSSSIYLYWTPLSEADYYKVYRSSSSSGTYLSIGNSTGASYTDDGLDADTTYYYKVSAVNDNGESEKSSYTEETTGSDGPPAAPTELSVTETTSNSISLSWNSVSGANAYNVYRATSDSEDYDFVDEDYDFIDIVYSTSFTDTGLSASTTYYYKVSAVNDNGESEKSDYVSEKTAVDDSAPTP